MEAQRRNLGQARSLFREAIAVDPGHGQSIQGLGQLEARTGNVAAALQLYQQGLEQQPRSIHLLSSLAHLQAQVRCSRQPSACLPACLPGIGCMESACHADSSSLQSPQGPNSPLARLPACPLAAASE
jgi:tetratricopeptide (TPR) repeat protein